MAARSKRRFRWSAALVSCLAFCSAIETSAAPLPLADCRLRSEIAGTSMAARCAWLSVPENREQPKGRQIRLHVAVVPALRLEPAADPLFILSGGPGQAAGDFYLSIAPALARVRRDRDLVVVDQRGTGRSNRLDCAFPDEGELSLDDQPKLRAAVRACLAGLPGDPRYYTTSVAVRDLDDVRAALGYQKIDLYGVSYGTRVAQHYMRRYPQRVRAAVLDGVMPPEVAFGPDIALDAQAAIDSAFARCQADAGCNRAFPDIAENFSALRSRLLAQPLTLSLPDPLNAEPTDTRLGAPELGAAVRLLSYSDETVSTLPLLIHETQAGRPQALAAQYLMIKRSMDAQFAYGMHFAVICSEDASRWMQQQLPLPALAQTYMSETFILSMKTICEQWPRGPVDADFGAPLTSATPTLVLSGSNDPVTPPRYGEQILGGLANARHLVLDGQGHGQITIGCVPRLVADFVASGDIDKVDDACIKTVAPAPFLLSRSAPAP